ncbi:MAG: RluA family pseudouridine synthase [Thermoleophilia bacterium]
MDSGSDQQPLELIVGDAEDGARLDVLLAGLPAVGSRAAAQKLIAGGLALVDGEPRAKNFRVRRGQRLAVSVPPPPVSDLVPEPMTFDIPYEDPYLLVVDKPAGIVTHPAKGHDSGTLVHGLLAHQIAGGANPHRPGIVHRLDKDTSGLLIVAKDEETHRLLVRMMAAHEVNRTYLALVHGLFETREGTVEAPVARDSRVRQRMAVSRGGREAVTHFRVLKSWTGRPRGAAGTPGAAGAHGGGFSLLEVQLETGRTHQIRVHLAAIGHPVAGDRVYGQRRDTLAVGRQFLHSARLNFHHPRTDEMVTAESPLPDDLRQVLDQLG